MGLAKINEVPGAHRNEVTEVLITAKSVAQARHSTVTAELGRNSSCPPILSAVAHLATCMTAPTTALKLPKML